MTSALYANAWLELLNRYENKRVIIRAHLTDLFEIRKIKDENANHGLLDGVTASLHGLRSCGENPEQWSTILSYLVLSKLEDTTKRDFENSFEDKKVYPPMKELTKFLEIQASAAEKHRGLSSYEKPRPSTAVPVVKTASRKKLSKKAYSVKTLKNQPCLQPEPFADTLQDIFGKNSARALRTRTE